MNPRNHFAYRIAYLHALRVGLSFHTSEDCATDFLETEWKKAGGLENLNALCRDSPALARKCALDFVYNFARAARRRNERESEWPQTIEENGDTLAWDALAHHPEPESKMVREAFWDLLLPFLEALVHAPCETFLRHYYHGETAAGIARSAGKTTHAVEQSLYRSREKLRAELERKGLSYGALRQFLAPPASVAPKPSA